METRSSLDETHILLTVKEALTSLVTMVDRGWTKRRSAVPNEVNSKVEKIGVLWDYRHRLVSKLSNRNAAADKVTTTSTPLVCQTWESLSPAPVQLMSMA